MDTVTSASAPRARLGFTSMEEEVRVEDAPVSGMIPDWLSGSVMRVSPGLSDIGGKPVGHWFDGLGMLNVFTIAGGRVSYASRFLDTGAYREARAATMTELARVEAPHHIPFNFHQQYFPDEPHSVEAGA